MRYAICDPPTQWNAPRVLCETIGAPCSIPCAFRGPGVGGQSATPIAPPYPVFWCVPPAPLYRATPLGYTRHCPTWSFLSFRPVGSFVSAPLAIYNWAMTPRPELSPFQRDAVVDVLEQYGELPLAARAAGTSLGYLRRCINADAVLAEEVESAMALHGSQLVVVAMGVVAKGGPGANQVLLALMDAKTQGFSKESRKVAAESLGRPEGLRLRTFDADGNDVPPGQAPQADPPSKYRDSAPPRVLRLSVDASGVF